MTRIGDFFALILFCLLVGSSAGATLSIQSTVDRDKVGLGDDFVFTITVMSDSAVEIQSPRPPDLDGFEVLETWDATAISQKLMPGPHGMDFQTQRKREFNFRLRPKRAGRLNIGAFDLTVDGKKQSTAPLVMNVSPQSIGKKAPPRGRPQIGGVLPDGMDEVDNLDKIEEEMFRQLLQRRGVVVPGQQPPGPPAIARPEPKFRSMPRDKNEAFFVQLELDKTEVYEGEQVTATWYLYTRGNMETLDRVQFPSLRGFWKEVIEEAPSIQFTEEVVNGIPYRKALLASHALFPIKAGTAIVDEYKIKSRVRLPLQAYGGMAFGPAYEYTKSSERVSLKVKPLPVEGRPSSFTGAVGTFEVHAATDSLTVPANQPFAVKLRFEGEGNAKSIELPAIDWPKSLEHYDTKSESQFFKNGQSFKQFDILVIPRQEGPLEIPSISVGIFNPKTGKYEERHTEPLKLQVVANTNGQTTLGKKDEVGQTNAGAPQAARATIKADELPQPILAFHAPGFAHGLFNQPTLWVALYLAVFCILAFKARLEWSPTQRRRNLQEILIKRFKALDKTVKGGDPRRIGAEMTNLFSLVLGDIAGETGTSQEIAKVLERIPPSLRRDFGAQILKRHEVFQVLAFAPTEALGELKNSERVLHEVQQAKALLQEIVKKSGEDSDAAIPV